MTCLTGVTPWCALRTQGPEGSESIRLVLPSGLVIQDPFQRLKKFCEVEYEYYDAVARGHPDVIEPIDVLATVGINSRLDTAEKVRAVHLGMREYCAPTLSLIPESADLRKHDLVALVDLLESAFKAKWVAMATATKVLHRKRPALIPVLDSVVVTFYLKSIERADLIPGIQESDRRIALVAAPLVLEEIRRDLISGWDSLKRLGARLQQDGYSLSNLRMLDILVWSEVEPRSYYRDIALPAGPDSISSSSLNSWRDRWISRALEIKRIQRKNSHTAFYLRLTALWIAARLGSTR